MRKGFAIFVTAAALVSCERASHKGTGVNILALGGTLTLRWQNNASNADGIRVQRRAGSTGDFATIATIGAESTTYADTELQPSRSYCYRVGAYNGAGVGWSQVVCASTATDTADGAPVATDAQARISDGSSTHADGAARSVDASPAQQSGSERAQGGCAITRSATNQDLGLLPWLIVLLGLSRRAGSRW